MASTLLAKTALRQALVVGARGPAVAAAARGAGVGSRRGLSWVKDVTVNVTFINHEVRVWGGEEGRRSKGCVAVLGQMPISHSPPSSLPPSLTQRNRV